jgi:enolase
LEVAASDYFNMKRIYVFKKSQSEKTSEAMVKIYEDLVAKYPYFN